MDFHYISILSIFSVFLTSSDSLSFITFRVNLPLSQGWVISKRKRKKMGSVIRADLNLTWKEEEKSIMWGTWSKVEGRARTGGPPGIRSRLQFGGKWEQGQCAPPAGNRAHGSLHVRLHLPPAHAVYTRHMSSSRAPQTCWSQRAYDEDTNIFRNCTAEVSGR